MKLPRTFYDRPTLDVARDLLGKVLVHHRRGVSTQVLQEFFVTATRKLPGPLSSEDAEQRVDELSRFDVVLIDIPLVRAAISLSREHKLSLWDALVVAAAEARGCSRLLSEDLQDGRQFGRVRVENPFRSLG